MKMVQENSGDLSNPVSGDLTVDKDGKVKVYNGTNWIEVAVPPSALKNLLPATVAVKPTPKVIERKYVVAGNHAEYKQWLREKGYSPHEWIYVHDVIVLRGVRNPHGFYVGSWEKRKDINDISMQIKIAQR